MTKAKSKHKMYVAMCKVCRKHRVVVALSKGDALRRHYPTRANQSTGVRTDDEKLCPGSGRSVEAEDFVALK